MTRPAVAVVQSAPSLAAIGEHTYTRTLTLPPEFFSRIEEQGARFEWCDEAEVFEVVPIERQRLSWILERNLRVATLYWRIRSGSFAIVASRALFGLALFAVLGMAGLVAAPFGFHRTVRLWCLAARGLGRIAAVSGVRWAGY